MPPTSPGISLLHGNQGVRVSSNPDLPLFLFFTEAEAQALTQMFYSHCLNATVRPEDGPAEQTACATILPELVLRSSSEARP